MIKYQDGANATQARERLPIVALTGLTYGNFDNRDQRSAIAPNHDLYVYY